MQLSLALLTLGGATLSAAQQPLWQFQDVASSSTSLQECQSITFDIPPSVAAKPPFGIWAWAAFGTSMFQSIGNVSTFKWSVAFPRDTPSAFTLLDADGTSLGTSHLFTVGQSSNNSCLDEDKRPPNVRMRLNATALEPCQSIAVIVSGGVPPYRFYISSVGSFFYANISIPSDRTAYAWVNNLETDQTLVYTAEDSQGNLAVTSGGIASKRTNGQQCPVQSTPIVDLPAQSYDTQGEIKKSRTTTIILGSVLGVVLSLILLLLAFFLLRRRRQRAQRSKVISAPVTPFSNRSMENVATYQPPASFGAASGAAVAAAPDHRRMQSVVSIRTDHSGYAPDSSAGSSISSIERPTWTRVQSHDTNMGSPTGEGFAMGALSPDLPSDPLLAGQPNGSQEHSASPDRSSNEYTFIRSPRLSTASGGSGLRRPLPSIPPGQSDIASPEDPQVSLDRKMRHMSLGAISEGDQNGGFSRRSQVIQHEDAGPAQDGAAHEIPPAYADRHVANREEE